MKSPFIFVPLFSFLVLSACSDNSSSPTQAKLDSGDKTSSSEEWVAKPIDYSKGRAMNKRLGKGINLGNGWDSQGKDDCGWSNCIKDEYFGIIKNTGFNSVRIPVRWNLDSDYETHTVSPTRLAGVKEDIQLAIDHNLAVVVNFHHYAPLFDLANGAHRGKGDSTALYKAEKEHFLKLWAQVAKEFDQFPDSMVVLEILNEPTTANAQHTDDLMNEAYKVIRENAKGKTIMFEAHQAAKFANLNILHLPEDGNIIYSGHYYDPYTYSHQGQGDGQYSCEGDKKYESLAASHFKEYVKLAQKLYPDINGDHIPMNMGEFGIAGRANWKCGENAPSDAKRALWTKKTIQVAESYGISWHYWDFTNASGFEAYNKGKSEWYPGFPEAFFP